MTAVPARNIDGDQIPIEESKIEQFKENLRGALIRPED